jgi:uncharacterized protein (DUF608 family)
MSDPNRPVPPAIRTFHGPSLLQIAMPMGGIGAGCICLNGHGGMQDFSIYNRPATTALPDNQSARDAGFATVRTTAGGRSVTRLVEGPMPVEKLYNQGLGASGGRRGGHEGLPRFRSCAFHACYPFGRVELRDEAVPVTVNVIGWSPFIPLDDHHSSLPCAAMEYTLTNASAAPVDVEFAFHMTHVARGRNQKNTRNARLGDAGVLFTNTEHPSDEWFGSAALAVVGHRPKVKAMWLRGGAWFDWTASLWREVSTGTFAENEGNTTLDIPGHNGGSVMVTATLSPGESISVPVLVTWHFPNSYLKAEQPKTSAPATAAVALPVQGAACDPSTGCCDPAVPQPAWRPYYAGHFKDAGEVATYVARRYDELRARTLAFTTALAGSTLPPEVLDAVTANLAILKSPTVLRQENGNVWGWEGCFTSAGCCPGTCTHVWNYAQSMPHLFPRLERTLREQELLRSMNEEGQVAFRAALPDGPTHHTFHPAADGQLGGIMKLYRDWQIGGDNGWMRSLYPHARRSLEYCIGRWDPDERGGLFEPHHNTYDIEFWGPDGMCTSIYVGALAAMAAMAQGAGEAGDAQRYAALAAKGARFMDAELFNGEYYQQRVMWQELRDRSFADSLERNEAGEEMRQLLRREGPKYQCGDGCLSDGVIGAWMAGEYGIDAPFDRDKIRSTLGAIHAHNFKASLWNHACTQRPGYAMGHEPGLIICTWPRGNKPTLPFVYSDEVWTGIEYQVASHLIREGMVDQGLQLVRAVRHRYDGQARNPFNEYECGSYYARAMASFAVLTALCGIRYSAVTRALDVSPRSKQRPFRGFFSTASGFGIATLNGGDLSIELIEGTLDIARLHVDGHDVPLGGTVTIRAGDAWSASVGAASRDLLPRI